MSKIISDEEIAKVIRANVFSDYVVEAQNLKTVAKAQRDSSDEEWIREIEKYQCTNATTYKKGTIYIPLPVWQALKSKGGQ